MLAIKLRPVGKKKQISYRVVVMEKKSKLVGKFIEDLGWYNPHTNMCVIKTDRINYWIGKGAQPTDTVHNILVKEKVKEGPKVPKHGKSKKPVEETSATKVEEKKEQTQEVANKKQEETPNVNEEHIQVENVESEKIEPVVEEKKEEITQVVEETAQTEASESEKTEEEKPVE